MKLVKEKPKVVKKKTVKRHAALLVKKEIVKTIPIFVDAKDSMKLPLRRDVNPL